MDLDELYQTVILDHSKRPRNKGPLEGATHHAAGHNPSCGDEISLEAVVRDGLLADLRFSGQGCAISQAAASLLTVKLKGKTLAEAGAMIDAFHGLVTDLSDDPAASPPEGTPSLGDLRVFEGVRKFPQRVKCATLAWNAAKEIVKSAS